MEVLNLRYERRESRDLLQDLRDVAAGIAVVHEADLKKAQKEAKHSRRIASQLSREEHFRKLIRTNGYGNLSASDRRRAEKHLSEEEIEAANHFYEQSLLPPPPDMQLSMEVGL